jgi:hypothetical protein
MDLILRSPSQWKFFLKSGQYHLSGFLKSLILFFEDEEIPLIHCCFNLFLFESAKFTCTIMFHI